VRILIEWIVALLELASSGGGSGGMVRFGDGIDRS
jgi:hypothetical protein